MSVIEMQVDGSSEIKILIETAGEFMPQAGGGVGRAGIGGQIANQIINAANATFTGAMGIISYSSNVLLAEMNKIDTMPDTAQIEFGIKINGQGKAMLASGGAEANFKVTLSWKKP